MGRGLGFTVDAWINPEHISDDAPIIEWNSGFIGVGLWMIHGYGAGALYADLRDEHEERTAIASPAGLLREQVFQHVALTYDRPKGVAALYLNGEVVAMTFVGNLAPVTSGDVYLGLHAYGEGAGARFAGQLDEVHVFNHTLTHAEIQRLYQAGEQGKVPKLAPK